MRRRIVGAAVLASLGAAILLSACAGAGIPPRALRAPLRVEALLAPVVGQTIVTTPGSWGGNPTRFTYQWLRCDASGSNCASIGGATSSSYTVQQADAGDTLRTVIVAYNGQGSAAQTSAQTDVIPSGGAVAQEFVATTGNDANSCSAASPCLSFNRAYTVASPGDTVEVANGTYDTSWVDAGGATIHGELIAHQAAKDSASSSVTFRPAAGATVEVNGNIRVLSSHVSFQNMQLGAGTARGDAEAQGYDPVGSPVNNNVGFITFQNITGRNFAIQGAHDISIIGGSYGPSSACGSNQPGLTQYGGGNNALRTEPTAGDPFNVLISGVTIHNIMSYDLVGCHTEGLAIFSCSSNCTVTGSKFYGNDVYDMLLQQNSGSGALGAITVTNNWFAASTNSAGTGSGSASVAYDNIGSNSVFANNSMNMAWQPDDLGANPNPTNFKIWGNIGSMPFSSYCPAAMSSAGDFKYNVWQNSSCDATDSNLSGAAMPFVSATNDATLNYALTGGVAQDFVPLANQLVSTDIAGNTRPDNGEAAIDAGGSEVP